MGIADKNNNIRYIQDNKVEEVIHAFIIKKEGIYNVFIESENESIYGNRFDFVDCSSWLDWKNLLHGQLVSYEVGTNSQGKCAKNIKIIKIILSLLIVTEIGRALC